MCQGNSRIFLNFGATLRKPKILVNIEENKQKNENTPKTSQFYISHGNACYERRFNYQRHKGSLAIPAF